MPSQFYQARIAAAAAPWRPRVAALPLPRYPPVPVYDRETAVDLDASTTDYVTTNLDANGPSRYRARLTCGALLQIWEGAMPRSTPNGRCGELTYASPPGEDGSRLFIFFSEIPYQSLHVRAEILRWSKEDPRILENEEVLLDTWLENTHYYAGGLRTELHAAFDDGALALDVWVEPGGIGRPYAPLVPAKK